MITMKSVGRLLVIGADGLFGRALVDRLTQNNYTLIQTTRRHKSISKQKVFLDLAEDVSQWQPPMKVSVAYFLAAVSSLEQCRRNSVKSNIVNVQHTVEIIKTLVDSGAFVIFPSTNLVFDGFNSFQKADDPVCPVTEYGRQKAEAERQLLALGETFPTLSPTMISIVRFTKVLSPNMPLLKEWINSLKKNEIIYPFSDMVMAPITLSFAVNVLHRIAEKRLHGIVQISGDRDVTYEQVARYIAQRIGVRQDLIQPKKSKESGLELEAIPSNTTLDINRMRLDLGLEAPNVWEAISTVFGL